MAEVIVSEVELEPAARLSADLDDLVEVISRALHLEGGYDKADDALDELVRRLNAHSNLTWNFARWWDVNTGPVNSEYAALYTRRWNDVMAAFRAAMEL